MSDPLERELLDAARRAYAPEQGADERVKARVLAALAAGAATSAGSAGSAGAAGTSAAKATTASGALVWIGVGAVGVAALAIAYGLSRGVEAPAQHDERDPTELAATEPARSVETPVVAPEPAQPSADTEPEAEPLVTASTPLLAPPVRRREEVDVAPSAPPRRAPRVSHELAPSERGREPASDPPLAAEPADEEDPLTAELALVEAAQAALRTHDGAGALELLGRHRSRFAAGTLAAERDTLEVEALCAIGAVDRARARAAQLLAAGPTAIHSGRLRASCAERAPTPE